MSTATGKALARAYFEDFMNAGRLDVAGELFAEDFRFHYPLGELQGIEAMTRYIAAVRTAFPDIRFQVQDLFGEGGRVACRWTLTGTQTGEFRGRDPSGRRVEVPGNTIFRVAHGRIAEAWVAFDPGLLP